MNAHFVARSQRQDPRADEACRHRGVQAIVEAAVAADVAAGQHDGSLGRTLARQLVDEGEAAGAAGLFGFGELGEEGEVEGREGVGCRVEDGEAVSEADG